MSQGVLKISLVSAHWNSSETIPSMWITAATNYATLRLFVIRVVLHICDPMHTRYSMNQNCKRLMVSASSARDIGKRNNDSICCGVRDPFHRLIIKRENTKEQENHDDQLAHETTIFLGDASFASRGKSRNRLCESYSGNKMNNVSPCFDVMLIHGSQTNCKNILVCCLALVFL